MYFHYFPSLLPLTVVGSLGEITGGLRLVKSLLNLVIDELDKSIVLKFENVLIKQTQVRLWPIYLF